MNWSYPVWIESRGHNVQVCNNCGMNLEGSPVRCYHCRKYIYWSALIDGMPYSPYKTEEEYYEQVMGEEEEPDTISGMGVSGDSSDISGPSQDTSDTV